jgi:bifunctional aspartokinase / homoserine dehydrogenase 1
MQVIKFGGSSVANADNINKVIDIITTKTKENNNLIVVVSALGGVTDLLLQAAAEAASNNTHYKLTVLLIEQKHTETINTLQLTNTNNDIVGKVQKLCNEILDICNGLYLLGELTNRIKDKIVSYGELLSSLIIAEKIKANGNKIQWKDARELIITNNNYSAAQVNFSITNKNINAFFAKQNNTTYILPGFISANETGHTTTLGRGGSDYTAAILAAGINAANLEIWTDVSGMMTADPRIVTNIKHIPEISYQEAMELSHFGAKVIYPPTIQPVMQLGIPVWIKNTFAPNDIGTVIKNEAAANAKFIRGISSINKISLLSLEGSGMVGIPGFSKRLFEALANDKINVILITQSSSEHSICVAIDAVNSEIAKAAVDNAFSYEIATKIVEPLIVETDLAIVALVGDNMKNHTGISGKLFSALGKNGINIRAIAQGSSERNISTVIQATDVHKAVNVLHEAFFETTYKQIHLFVAGVGNVGKRLLSQLLQQIDFLQNTKKLQLKLMGLANSKQMLISNNGGINLNNWEVELKNAPTSTIENFVETILAKNLRNTIFIDVTANDAVATMYNQLLQKSIAVVACNKVAASSSFATYKKLKEDASEFNANFLFETNVGAGLPIIGSLNDLINSGDKINKIEAVLSGTLNYVFNNYNGSKSFASVVRDAQNEGYTEPDPRLDFGGKDVARKLLILAREAGEQLEMDDIENVSFMPETCMQGTVEDFYTAMEKEEVHFKAILNDAKENGNILKFVASFNRNEDGTIKTKVGLQHINPQHDFYHLYGKDNIVLFYTNRYIDQPMVIKGAGAGAEVTASGVFADIIRAAF